MKPHRAHGHVTVHLVPPSIFIGFAWAIAIEAGLAGLIFAVWSWS